MTMLGPEELQDLLNDPHSWEVKDFLQPDPLWDADEWNTDNWNCGEAVLLKAKAVVPIPTGKFRLP